MIVATREQAQLIVEVNEVRTANMADEDLLNDEFRVSVLIKRGPQLPAAQFATVPRTYRFPQVTRLAAPTDAAPWWRFEGPTSGPDIMSHCGSRSRSARGYAMRACI